MDARNESSMRTKMYSTKPPADRHMHTVALFLCTDLCLKPNTNPATQQTGHTSIGSAERIVMITEVSLKRKRMAINRLHVAVKDREGKGLMILNRLQNRSLSSTDLFFMPSTFS